MPDEFPYPVPKIYKMNRTLNYTLSLSLAGLGKCTS